ncbi:MAG: cation:proton antiporter, partial [Myxococcota bacterium]
MKAPTDSPIDFLRKSLIVVALIGAILLLHQFAEPATGLDPRGLLALGFVVLAAYTIGELAAVVRIPHITGYLLAGILFGPSTAALLAEAFPVVRALPPLDEGILSERVLGQLGLVDSLALAMIALTAGGELKLEELKKSFRHVLGTTLAMVGAVVVMVTLFAVVVLPQSLPLFHSLEPGPRFALAVVLAVLAAATSPAVSIAVVNSTGARGPVATTVLTGVVVGEITVVLLFSATSSVALGMLGGTGSVTVVEALASVGASIGVGAIVGVLVATYLRFIAQELLLFLVSTIFVTTFVIRELHGEAAVAFITAGLIVGNFSDRGELLIREVERLSRPVYVVFFALAGAHLHLETLRVLLLPAAGLFAVRAAAVYWGARWGARATDAPATVQSYAWMGFVSQAGLAIALAGQARDVLPSPVSESLYSMAMAVIALCELVGPLVLQTGLQLAGEIPNGAPTDLPRTTLPPAPDDPLDDPWGLRVPTGSEALDRAIGELEIELNALLEEHAAAPLGQLRRDGEHTLRQLRREALRTLRRAATRAAGPELASQLRDDLAENARQWRDLVRARPASTTFDLLGLIEALDRQVARLPSAIEAGVVDSVWVARNEPLLTAARRAFGRVRNQVVPIRRSVDLHALGRFHLSGRAPTTLEALAAGVLRVELRLAEEIGLMSAALADGLELAAAAAERGQPEQVGALLTELRTSADAGFDATASNLQRLVFDETALATRIVGQAFAAIHHDAMVVGTLDLAPRARRYRKVYAERSAALPALAAGIAAGRALVGARHQQLGLELELLGAEARFRSFVRRRAAGVAREVRQRGPMQLARAVTTLGELLGSTELLLAASPTAGAVSRHVRRHQELLSAQIHQSIAAVGALATDLAGERWIAALLQELEAETQDLSESYSVPAAYEPVERALPAPVPQHDVDFRELVAGFVETRVARDLVDLTGELLERVRGMASALEEVERVAAFNLELSCAEIDVLDDDAPVPPETLELVRAMVSGAIGRGHHRLVQELEVSELTADQTEPRVVDAVMEQLASLREQLLRGRIAELRSTWMRDRSKGALAR